MIERRRGFTRRLGAWLAAGLAGWAAPVPAQPPACDGTLVQADRTWSRAVANQDHPAVVAAHAGGGRLHVPGRAAVVGEAAIAAFWRRLFPGHRFAGL